MTEMTEAVFIRKAANVRELMDEYFAHREDWADPFTVEKVIVLSDSDYQVFAQHGLMQDVEYIFDNRTIMEQDPRDRCWHCLLIKAQTLAQGILVDSEGYSYARYAAFVPDCSQLELANVPVDQQYMRKVEAKRTAPLQSDPER